MIPGLQGVALSHSVFACVWVRLRLRVRVRVRVRLRVRVRVRVRVRSDRSTRICLCSLLLAFTDFAIS